MPNVCVRNDAVNAGSAWQPAETTQRRSEEMGDTRHPLLLDEWKETATTAKPMTVNIKVAADKAALGQERSIRPRNVMPITATVTIIASGIQIYRVEGHNRDEKQTL
jgi:hypothetical protein